MTSSSPINNGLFTTFWTFDSGDEACIELVLTTPAEVDQVSLLVGGLGDNSHITKMKLEVKQENENDYQIPEDMKQKIMAQLGVSSEHIDEALSLAQKSPNIGVTPFLQHMNRATC